MRRRSRRRPGSVPLLVAGALERAAGLGEEDVVERRLVQLQVLDPQALGIECTHDLGQVGIIDHGHLVAEGTPAALKAEIGRPTVEAVPREQGDRERLAAVLARFGPSSGASPRGAAARLEGGEAELAEVVRALDAEGIAIETLQLHAPSLDDVFLAKTGRSLEGAGDAEEEVEIAAEAVESP